MTFDAELRGPDRELPCQLCGETTLEDFLEPAPECCARERLVCPTCVARIEAEEREERREHDFNMRQFVDMEALR